jgi:hypothetical protein
MAERPMALSFVQLITLSLSLLQRMASNDDGKSKMEEEAESSMARKQLWISDDDNSDDDSSDSFDLSEREPEEEEDEVSSEETSMNQLDSSEERLHVRRACGILFSDDGDTASMSLEPYTPKSHRCSDEESSNDDDDDFWM